MASLGATRWMAFTAKQFHNHNYWILLVCIGHVFAVFGHTLVKMVNNLLFFHWPLLFQTYDQDLEAEVLLSVALANLQAKGCKRWEETMWIVKSCSLKGSGSTRTNVWWFSLRTKESGCVYEIYLVVWVGQNMFFFDGFCLAEWQWMTVVAIM